MNPADKRIGVVGLGIMGSAISKHLLRRGYPVSGFDVDKQRLDEFASAGGDSRTCAADVAENSDIVIASLPSAAALRVITDELKEAKAPGLVLVETSTLDAADKIVARDELSDVGVVVLDCPLSGTGAQARDGDLVAFVSGDEQATDDVAPVLETFCRETVRLGEFGAGTTTKLIANLLVAVHTFAAAEALTLADRAGLRLEQIISALAGSAADSRMLQVRGPVIARRSWQEPSMRLELFLKDLALITSFAQSVDAQLPLFTTTQEYFRQAADAGLGSYDSAAVAALLRDESGDLDAGRNLDDCN
ncbi:NAD(P)-dependent oxidoreductase [Gordonia sp. SW 21]|uniref:NAD(P)-dependent oxidoreductase n=1 Tax=Gordonia aquimaris TaxID=2984863 RepID=A0A9X3I488_9ACTN|nr:NAD(P)-dependent oxidoreductase [Gordonia aquimaris]